MRRLIIPSLAVLAVVGFAALVASACGDGGKASCGNGVVEEGEDCDKGADNGKAGVSCSGTCKSVSVLIPGVQVHWSMLAQSVVNSYTGTTCSALGADNAHIIIAGPSRIEQVLPCKLQSKLFSCTVAGDAGAADCSAHLLPGDYAVTITLEKNDSTAVTRSVSTPHIKVVAGAPTNFDVDFEQDDFLGNPYFGSLQIRTWWGQDHVACAGATPGPVVKQAMKLLPKNMYAQSATSIKSEAPAGTPLDGTPAACYTPDGNTHSSEIFKGLAWGPYQLLVSGYVAGQMAPAYCGSTDIFVGPGDNNQIFYPIIPLYSPDAGVPDGGGLSNCP